MTAPGDELALRAGDLDRERAAAELRRHHLAGRLDSDELEERLGLAYRARTLGDLVPLLADLPVLDRKREAPTPARAARSPAVGGYGLLAFAQVHELPVGTERAYAEALDSIVRAMLGFGYDLVERHDGQSLTFETSERPAWVRVVCVAAFPFGLLALLVRHTTRVRVDFVAQGPDGCRVTVSGEARRPVRRAFSTLSA